MNKEMEKKLQPQRSTGQKELQTQRSMGHKELHSMGTAIRPVERHGMEAIKFFLYDPKEGRVLGRDLKSWALITIFYTIYYAMLAGFWALCFFIFYSTTINDYEPRWNGKDWNGSGRMGKSPALIGQSPALGIRPVQSDALIESSMIMYNYQQEKDDEVNKIPGFGGWASRTGKFLKQYNAEVDGMFSKTELGKCGKGKFGWDEGKPCIFLKLNRIYGLEHAYYNQTWNSTEPGYISKEKEKDFPDFTIEYLNNTERSEKEKNQVWVHCKGENVADQENMGDLTYFPDSRGFHEDYNLFNWAKRKEGYRSPLVAIKFNNPKNGVFLHVECRAWAKNIGYDHMDRIGKAHFELIIYNSTHNPLAEAKP